MAVNINNPYSESGTPFVQPLVWALTSGQDLKPHLVATLLALAWYADPFGCGSYPTLSETSALCRKTRPMISRDIRRLHEAGFITPGNQDIVAHIVANRRPHVWDLAMDGGDAA